MSGTLTTGFDAPDVIPNFPNTPLGGRVEIELGGSWVDITDHAFTDTITIGRGHPDESTTAAPSTLAITLNNADGRFSSQNPNSPYYPDLSLNTPVRVSIPDVNSHLRCEYDGAMASCPAPSGVSFATAFQCVIDVDWDGSGVILATQDAAGAGELSWEFAVDSDGVLTLNASTNGTILGGNSSASLPIRRGRVALRATFTPQSGAEPVFAYWYMLGGLQSGNPWVELTAVPTAGWATGTGLFVSTSPVQVGYSSYADTQLDWPTFEGKVYAFVLDGSGVYPPTDVFASADFTSLPAGTVSFTDAQGNVWTVTPPGEISDREYRYHGVIAAWPQTWTPGDPNARVAIAGSGLLRQLSASQASVNSAMQRSMLRLTTPLPAYWPLEDVTSTTISPSAVGGPNAVWEGVPQPASSSGFAGSGSLPQLNGASLFCPVPTYASIGSVADPVSGVTASDALVRFLLSIPSGGDTDTGNICTVFYTPGGTLGSMALDYGVVNGGSLRLTGYSPTGAVVWQTAWFANMLPDGGNGYVAMDLRNTGSGTYTASLTVVPTIGSATIGYGAGSATAGVSGTITNVSRIVFNANPAALLSNTAIGHVSVQTVWQSLFNLSGPMLGWYGESALTRFARLCGEEGIACRTVGYGSAPMGAQTQETIATLLQECADADRGMWFEPRNVLGFGYRARTSLGNAQPVLTLDYNADQVDDGLAPTLDDQTVHNDITVTTPSSTASARVTLDDGSAYSIGSIGRYDTSLSINIADTSVNDMAGWVLHTSTVPEARYTAIAADLANRANTSLWQAILAVDAGDRIMIKNQPQWLSSSQIDQIAQGFQENIGIKTLNFQWNTIPASPWSVSYLDQDPGLGTPDDPYAFARADTSDSVLDAGVTATATTLPVETVSGPLWTTSSSDLPFDIEIGGGERATVTAIGAQTKVATKFGAYLDQAAYGTSGWPATAAAFTSITGITLNAARWYAGTSYTAGAAGWTGSLSTLGAAGTRICLDIMPTTTDPTQLAQLDAFLAAAQAQGADVRVSLFHEPYYGGLSAAQFQAIWNYYAPTVRKYFECWAVFSGNDAVESNGYMPNPALVDGIAADCYGYNTTDLVNCQTLADKYGKPLGLWEFSAAFDLGRLQAGDASPINSAVTLAASESWFTSIQSIFTTRLADKRPNGDILLFTGGTGGNTGSGNFLGTSLSPEAGFEGGIGTWGTNSAATIAGTTAQAHSGTGSLSITTVTAGTVIATNTTTYSQGVPCVPGQYVISSCWSRAATTAREVQAEVKFYSSTGTLLGSTADPAGASNSTSAWTFTSVAAAAPASTAYATFQVQILGTAVGEVHYIDDVQLGILPASGTTDHTGPVQFPWDYRIPYIASLASALDGTGVTGPQAFTVTRSVNGVSRAWPEGTDVRLALEPTLSY